jgi:hypothetical protein
MATACGQRPLLRWPYVLSRPAPALQEPATKGSTIREFLLWYHERHGQEAMDDLLRALPASAAAQLSPEMPALGILSASWYPMSLTHPMLTHVADRCGQEGREFAMEANREVVPRMIRGVYRVMFQAAASPELYARHIGRLWRRLHTTGDRSMVIRAPGEALSRVDNWHAHHPMSCWVTIYTMAYVFEAMGYKSWSVDRLSCVAHGAQRCETLLRYSK